MGVATRIVENRGVRGVVLKERRAGYNDRRGRKEVETLKGRPRDEIGRAVMKASSRKMNFSSHLKANVTQNAPCLVPHHRVWRSKTAEWLERRHWGFEARSQIHNSATVA